MEKTITEAEIAALKAQAVKEKNDHAEIVKLLGFAHINEISAEKQVEIVKRGRTDEIKELLKTYRVLRDDEDNYRRRELNLCAEAQFCIYQTDNHELITQMLKDTKLAVEFEKKLLDEWMESSEVQSNEFDKEAWENSGLYQKLSSSGEVYLIEKSLERAKKRDNGRELMRVIHYYENYTLSEAGQIALLECLKLPYGRDSLLDMLRECVRRYISRGLCLQAQKKLIAYGDTRLIIEYIQTSEHGLEVEEDLLKRGNREEIEAYFARYPFL